MAEAAATAGGRVALVAGASGLVGRELVAQLCTASQYGQVIALLRRPVDALPAKCATLVVDFDHLERSALPHADDAFCALGTTIKAAGSQDAFYRVDYTFCLEFARAALAAGARRLCMVTALGANPQSRVFYSRVKGEIETAVRQLGFESVHIFRPSFLSGQRSQSRAGEQVMLGMLKPLAFLTPARYRPVAGREVARAMIRAAQDGTRGTQVHESEQIRAGW
jgi:uncharacterized protein YbjT (DUF2867 family)